MTIQLYMRGPAQATVPLDLLSESAGDGHCCAAVVWAFMQGAYGHYQAGIFPGQQRLAAELGVSHSTVKRALTWLERRGWVEVERRTTADGRQTTNAYTLVADPVQPDDPDLAARRRQRELATLTSDLAHPVDNPGDTDPANPAMSESRGGSRVTPTPRSPVTRNSILSTNEELRARELPVDDPELLRIQAALGHPVAVQVYRPDAAERDRVRAGPIAQARARVGLPVEVEQ